MGGRAQRLPPKEHRKNSVLALIRFVSLLFLCALLLLFSLLFFLLLLVLVSGVVCLVLCFKLLNITPHKFPKAGGGHGGRAQRLPPKEHRKNIVLALIRFVSLLFLCALLLLFSLLFFLLLFLVSGVVCLVLCFKLLNITPQFS